MSEHSEQHTSPQTSQSPHSQTSLPQRSPQPAGAPEPDINHNIAERLRWSAREFPHRRAVVFPVGRDWRGRVTYSQLTFSQLDDESDRLAQGLLALGAMPGARIVLMVPPSLEFIALTFALFKVGAVCVLIDPGMGRSNIFRCLEEVDPNGFVGIPLVHVLRQLKAGKFPNAIVNVCVGRRRWGCLATYAELIDRHRPGFQMPSRRVDDPAAIIFTSGSTGPPKGVLYEHGMFEAQVDLLRDFYAIEAGEVDLPGFPLFALFNSAMGVTTVIPDMNPTRPAQVDPVKILEAIRDQGVTQAFGSPALWNRVGRYCVEHGISIPNLRRVLSAGAPVPNHVLQTMLDVLEHPEADMHTPYGATESLPLCSINARRVLEHTAAQTRTGRGTCVGRTFPGIELKVVRIEDGPIEQLTDAEELPAGQIGEIIVSGPIVTKQYYRRPQQTALAKIRDGERIWHRMGDVGYRDTDDAVWFCGRKAHIVETAGGRLFTIPCEAVFNNHPRVYRSALVGVGPRGGQTPVIVVEPEPGEFPDSEAARRTFRNELLELGQANPLTAEIHTILFHRSLPVDIRHNVKIFREKLGPWAEQHLKRPSETA